MSIEIPRFPIIEFHDSYGHIHIIKEIQEDETFDGNRKTTYISYEGEEFVFVIRKG